MTEVPAKYARDFALLEAAAVANERCPKNQPFGPLQTNAMSTLRDAGCVRVEQYGRGYRVVEILLGPHDGRRTKADPRGQAPWMINGRQTDPDPTGRAERRQQPSPPRLIPGVK